MDEDDKNGVLGCAAALLAIGAVVGGVVWFLNREAGPEPEVTVAAKPLTQVAPVREKTVVAKAAPVEPMARKIVVAEPLEETPHGPPPPARVIASVRGLDGIPQGPPPKAVEAVAALLDAEHLCYRGRLARRAPSLFDPTGFAVTYGADDFSGGDPLPRLEVFFHPVDAPTTATYLSMTEKDMPGFPANKEMPVVYDEAALQSVVARWIASVATETCTIPD